MQLYIVTKNGVPSKATINEQEARESFDDAVHTGRYWRVAVLSVLATGETRIVHEAGQNLACAW